MKIRIKIREGVKRIMTRDERRYYGSMISLVCILIIAIIFLGINVYDKNKNPDEAIAADKTVNTENEEYVSEEVAGDVITADVPKELSELLERNPEVKEFVEAYPDRAQYMGDIDISDDYVKGEIPFFLQWDKRWGYQTYGDGIMALEGCGPTCLSMVLVGLTGDTKYNPKYVADYSYDNGFYADGSSKWELMTYGAQKLGLTVKELPLWKNSIDQELKNGNPVICIMGPGDFTDDGHFIVITDVDSEGVYTLHDPNSRLKSEKKWSYEELKEQIKNIWAYSI